MAEVIFPSERADHRDSAVRGHMRSFCRLARATHFRIRDRKLRLGALQILPRRHSLTVQFLFSGERRTGKRGFRFCHAAIRDHRGSISAFNERKSFPDPDRIAQLLAELHDRSSRVRGHHRFAVWRGGYRRRGKNVNTKVSWANRFCLDADDGKVRGI